MVVSNAIITVLTDSLKGISNDVIHLIANNLNVFLAILSCLLLVFIGTKVFKIIMHACYNH